MRSVRTRLVWVLVVIGLGGSGLVACSGSADTAPATTGEVTSTTSIATTTTESPSTTTTTTEPFDPVPAVLAILGDPEFSATIEVERVQSQSVGDVVYRGEARIVGDDSSMLVEVDFGGLSGTYWTEYGAVGQGGLTSTQLGSVVVDGAFYSLDDGRWKLKENPEPGTTAGHVLATLAGVEDFGVSGPDAGTGHYVLTPRSGVQYDPLFFDLNPDLVERFDAETEMVVDGSGTPIELALVIDQEITGTPPATIQIIYRFSDVGTTPPISPPEEAWVSLSSLGFETAVTDTEGFAAVDMHVPVAWEVEQEALGFRGFLRPDGWVVRVLSFTESAAPIDQDLEFLLEALGVEASTIEELPDSLFPSRLAVSEDIEVEITASGDDGSTIERIGTVVFTYLEVQNLGDTSVVLAIVWAGSIQETDDQREAFESFLQGITWALSDPGTLAGPELQEDTMTLLRATTSLYCEDPTLLRVELVDGRVGGWTEDWYLDSCGTLEIYTIDFMVAADGGTDLLVYGEPRRPALTWLDDSEVEATDAASWCSLFTNTEAVAAEIVDQGLTNAEGLGSLLDSLASTVDPSLRAFAVAAIHTVLHGGVVNGPTFGLSEEATIETPVGYEDAYPEDYDLACEAAYAARG